MNTRIKYCIVIGITLLGICLFPLALSAQSGWTQDPGHYYAKISYSWFSGDTYYDTLGFPQQGVPVFQQRNVFVYGEYGLQKALTLLVNWPAWRQNRIDDSPWVKGFGDPQIGFRYALPLPLAISVGLATEIPLGKADGVVDLAGQTYNLPTGDGEWNTLATLAVSHSFFPDPAYIQGFLQFNLRTNYQGIPFRNQWRYGLELGYQPHPRWWINTALRGQVLAGSTQGMLFGDFTRGDGTTFNQLHLGLSYQLYGPWHLTVDYENFTDFFAPRRNLYSAPMIILGVALDGPTSAVKTRKIKAIP